eukprot:10321763-Heterocapsa_arctica.AAC.1
MPQVKGNGPVVIQGKGKTSKTQPDDIEQPNKCKEVGMRHTRPMQDTQVPKKVTKRGRIP